MTPLESPWSICLYLKNFKLLAQLHHIVYSGKSKYMAFIIAKFIKSQACIQNEADRPRFEYMLIELKSHIVSYAMYRHIKIINKILKEPHCIRRLHTC